MYYSNIFLFMKICWISYQFPFLSSTVFVYFLFLKTIEANRPSWHTEFIELMTQVYSVGFHFFIFGIFSKMATIPRDLYAFLSNVYINNRLLKRNNTVEKYQVFFMRRQVYFPTHVILVYTNVLRIAPTIGRRRNRNYTETIGLESVKSLRSVE